MASVSVIGAQARDTNSVTGGVMAQWYPGGLHADQSRIWPVYALGCHGDLAHYGDEYYFYLDRRACTNLTERWQVLFSRYS